MENEYVIDNKYNKENENDITWETYPVFFLNFTTVHRLWRVDCESVFFKTSGWSGL
jgi:hypothetical protein